MSYIEEDRNLLKDVAVPVVLSIILSRLPLGEFFYTIPLLLAAPKFKKLSHALIPFFVSACVCTFWSAFQNRALFRTGYYAMFYLTLLFPVSIMLCAIFWVLLQDYSSIVIRKVVICTIPVAVITLGFALWLSGKGAASELEGLKNSIKALFDSKLYSGTINVSFFVESFTTVILLMVVPMGMVLSVTPVLLSDFIIHKFDEEWQDNFAFMALPSYYAWFFLALWAVAVSANFVNVYPVWLSVVVWNLALGISLHYMLEGISIAVFLLRKKNRLITSGKVFSYAFLLCIMPGINLVVCIALTVTGVLETWLDIRK